MGNCLKFNRNEFSKRNENLVKNIVLIEDDALLADQLKSILERHDFHVEYFPNAEHFLLARRRAQRSLYLIDMNLPGIGGKELINLIRVQDKLSAIYMLSGSFDDRVISEVLRMGADDTIAKPFNAEHLVMKLNNAFNKLNQLANDQMSVGIKLIPEADLVMREGKALKLTAKEYAIIEQLLADTHKIHNREDLIESIGSKEITSRTIDVHVSCLRRKLEPIALEIETIRGKGYRVVVKELKTAVH
jgi:DNA-binding response OmpR family regulator